MDVSLVTLFLGALLGAVVVWSWRVSERERDIAPVTSEPVVPPDVVSVLAVLRSSAVLVGTDDAVLDVSAPARALGLVRGDRLAPPELVHAVHEVRRDGQIREIELVIGAGRSSLAAKHVTARVAPLGRLVLVLAEDRTRERRVESIRRDFVANVSHELKTPVGALALLAEAIGEAADDPASVRRFAGRMRSESERLNRLVQQIIELSRLQGDELVAAPAPVSVAAVVDAALDRVRTDAEAAGVTLASRVDPRLRVLGSAQQIDVAVANLVENAVTYSTSPGRVAVTAESDKGRVSITVSDQGIGIAPAELDRIFERFYRVDPARSRSTGGTGLGLSIAKHVAVSHGGEITVWSMPGQGSSFTLHLPAATPVDMPRSAALPTAPELVEATQPVAAREASSLEVRAL